MADDSKRYDVVGVDNYKVTDNFIKSYNEKNKGSYEYVVINNRAVKNTLSNPDKSNTKKKRRRSSDFERGEITQTSTGRGTKTETKIFDNKGNLKSSETTFQGKVIEGEQPTKAQITGNEPQRLRSTATFQGSENRFVRSARGYIDQARQQSISQKEANKRQKTTKIALTPQEVKFQNRNKTFSKLNKKTSETRLSDLAFEKSNKLYKKGIKEKYLINPFGVRNFIDIGKSATSGATGGALKVFEIDYKKLATKSGQAIKSFTINKNYRNQAIQSSKESFSRFVIDFGSFGADKLGVKETKQLKAQRESILGDSPRFKDSMLVQNPIGATSSFAVSSFLFSSGLKLFGKGVSGIGRSVKGGVLKTANKPIGNIKIQSFGKVSGVTKATKLSSNIPINQKLVLSYSERLKGFRGNILRQKAQTRIISTPKGILKEQIIGNNKFLTIQKKESNFARVFSGKNNNIKLRKTFKINNKAQNLEVSQLFKSEKTSNFKIKNDLV